MRSRNAETRVWIGISIAAVVVGVFLRVDQLASQILVDDEWHSIHKLLSSDYADIATHFGLADYCIPLTLYFKFLTQHGGLTEWAMRWPMLLSGIALLFVAPWWLRRRASATTLAVWTALLAISPMMTYHSRVTRPYTITTLLVFVAIMAFYEWWTAPQRRWRWAAIYVVCAVMAGWFHLIVVPFVLLPFVFFGADFLMDAVRDRSAVDWRKFAVLFGLGVFTAALLTILLLPPLIGDWLALSTKSGTGHLSIDSVYRTLLVCFGVSGPIVFVILIALFSTGIVTAWRHERRFVAYIGTVALGGSLAIAIMHPAWIQNAVTYGRYVQPIVPFLLLFVAEGFAFVCAILPAYARAAAVVAGIAGLIFSGPTPGYWYEPNQFVAHPYFQADYDPAHNPIRTALPPATISDFYKRLSAQPPRSLTLIEAPWSIRSDQETEDRFQAVHRQLVRIGLAGPICGSPQYGEFDEASGIRLRHFVHVTALLRGEHHGDFLVMHRNAWPAPRTDWPSVAACLPTIESKLGAPVFDDGDVVVFAISDKARSLAPELR